MAKIHELLAAENDLENLFKEVLKDTAVNLQENVHLFVGAIATVQWLDDSKDRPAVPPDYQEMTTTVDEQLDIQKNAVIRYFDALLQKERTNQDAKADIIVDGKKIAEDVPATFLLGLEKRLSKVIAVYDKIPTLPPSIKWEIDETKGPNVYSRVHPEEVFKTEKVPGVQVLYKHTKEHPAQVKEIHETKNVAIKKKEIWTSVFSPARKIKTQGKLNKLLIGVKEARQRANMTEVVKVTIGADLFKYIDS
jgi:hypothetical protein